MPSPPDLESAAQPAELVDSDLTREPVFLMARASSLGSATANRALAELDLKVRHYSVLSLVCSDTRPTQRQLSSFLVLDPSQIVLIVDALERRGAVRRQPDPSDRRSKIIVATEQGRQLYRKASAAVAECTDRTLAALSDAERDTLQTLLRRIALT